MQPAILNRITANRVYSEELFGPVAMFFEPTTRSIFIKDAVLCCVIALCGPSQRRQVPSLRSSRPSDALLQRVEIRLRGLQVGIFKALAEAIVYRL